MIEALASVSGVSVSLVALPGLSANFNPDDFAIGLDSCVGNLAANQQCAVDITFHPTTIGLREAALLLTDSAGDTFALNVAGAGRTLVMMPPASAPNCVPDNPQDNAFMYCNEPVGATSGTQTFSIFSANAITGFNILPTAVSGLAAEFDAADFTIESTTCTGTLAANASCTVTVAFTPMNSGLREIALTAMDSEGDRPAVYLAGHTSTGLVLTPLSASCSLASFEFCSEPVGGTTAPNAFTLTNISGAQITGLSVPTTSVAGDFRVTDTSCVSVLAAGASCTLNLIFAPQAKGILQDIISISDSTADIGMANFAGSGDDYELQIASGQASELTVPQGGTVTFKAQAVSDGVFGQNAEQVAFFCPSPSNLPPFTSCVTNPCPGSISPNSTVNFQIVFVTSSSTVTASVPEPTTPPGCTGYGAQSNPGLAMPRATGRFSGRHSAHTLTRRPLFSSMTSIMTTVMIGAFFCVRSRFGSFSTIRPFVTMTRSVLVISLFAVAAAVMFSGCHHSGTSSSGTPVGQTTMNIQGVALDSHGNALNATRGLPAITIDVIAAQ